MHVVQGICHPKHVAINISCEYEDLRNKFNVELHNYTINQEISSQPPCINFGEIELLGSFRSLTIMNTLDKYMT